MDAHAADRVRRAFRRCVTHEDEGNAWMHTLLVELVERFDDA